MAARSDKVLAKKTFNAVAAGLFKELSKLFPGDVKVKFLFEELQAMSKTPADAHVPAVKFFKAANTPSGVESLASPGSIAAVGELIINKDERLFTDAKASIPELDAMDFKGKWALLSPANKEEVWKYLDRMVSLSARVSTLEALRPEEIALIKGMVNPTSAGDVAALMKDPAILELGEKIAGRMATGLK